MTAAMDGWVTPWAPTGTDDHVVRRVLATTLRCLGASTSSADPVRAATSAFSTSDRVVATFSAAQLAPPAGSALESETAVGLGHCGAEPAITQSYLGGGRVGFYDVLGTGHPATHVWLAGLGGRVGLLAVGGTSYPPVYDTIDRTSDLVIGALRHEATFADTAMVPASTGTARHVAAPPAVATARHRRRI